MNRNPARLRSAVSSTLLAAVALCAPAVVSHHTVTAPRAAAPTVAARPAAFSVHAALPANPTNPLAGRPWGNYLSPYDGLYDAWSHASGTQRRLLSTLTFQPRMRWFGSWSPADKMYDFIRQYITTSQRGNPNALVQFALFALDPWEGAACRALPTAAQQATYKRWMTNVARAIGQAHVAILMQPDLPFAFCAPQGSLLPLNMVNWATQLLSKLPNTSVYLDAGAQDWKKPGATAWMLRMAGVRWARGFALSATHFDSTSNQVYFGGQLLNLLAAAGIRGKHFIVDTVQNAHPFKAGEVSTTQFNNSTPCSYAGQRYCSALGIPPTTDVANPRWKLGPKAQAIVARDVDAFMWYGRPWLRPVGHFMTSYALTLARMRSYPTLY